PNTELDTNSAQPNTELDTNLTQPNTELDTNSAQPNTELDTNLTQPNTQPNTELDTNSAQLSSKGDDNALIKQIESINVLSGNERKIFEYLANSSVMSRGQYIAKNLSKKDISSGSTVPVGSVNTSLIRLIEKIVIKKTECVKGGKNATASYLIFSKFIKEFNSPIYNSNTTTNTINKYSNDTKEQNPTTPQNDQLIELIKQQNDKIAELQKQFLQQAPQVQLETKNVTVTELTETNTLKSDNDDWLNLDFSSLTEFGFTKRHVTQIKNFNKSLDADNQLTVDSVQESIEHYAWALQNRLEEMASYAPANNRLRGLIGVLKKGGNWTEANYKSPEDLAFEASLKAKEERLIKLKEQKERVFNIEFELWREALTATEITDIEENGELQGKMPPSAFKNKGDNKLYVAALKTYFKNNVYGG
ncbi:hypothetical protein, partial [Cysteiniphilum litorale]|uniref:hypothetical protein n=2 Tax=Cysteiniphilum litorale TaxID=2056700 RepID=UPI003F885D34